MSWLGKIIGGAIGWMLMGPLGVILGAAMGHLYDVLPEGKTRLNHQEERQMTFFVSVFSMLGKMAAPDGRIAPREAEIIRGFIYNELRMGPQEARLAAGILEQASVSRDRFEDFARQFYQNFSRRPELLRMMYDILLRVAIADGTISSYEQGLLDEAARIFGIGGGGPRMEQAAPDRASLYGLLGVSSEDSNEVIKKKYRALVKENHPDRIASQGLPAEFREMAAERFRKIQQAYETIREERGF